VHNCCETVERLVGVDGLYLENTILNGIEDGMSALREHAVPGVVSQSLEYAKVLGVLGGFLVTFLIATVLLAKDYDDIMNQLLDREDCHMLLEVICGVIRYIATFVKAQAVIMAVIGLTGAVTLGLARIHNGVLWGILAGLLDALPFVGTGIVLMPLAVAQLVQGSYGKAVVCVLLYLTCIFLREMLEPKLIGRRMGVPPIAVLLSLYMGIQLFGVWGIVKGPLGFVLIRESYLSIKRAERSRRELQDED
ncbi:MAG: AI-2E family transporter, partial [Acetatifactor sp.]|nr:AI-2E family transporter [Acetatifactor sp.]